MLKALSHRKLHRRLIEADDADSPEDGTPQIEPTRREDPLTATIFERLAYLPSSVTWDVLCKSTKPLGNGPSLPNNAPSHAPTWLFWPSLRPGADGRNKTRVEPDVVAIWGDSVLVFEAKHRDAQNAAQWLEQVRAVCEAPEFAKKQIWFIAVGGVAPHEHEAHWTSVRNVMPSELRGALTLRWDDLRCAIDQCASEPRPHEQLLILQDIAEALAEWGYRKKTWFSTLREMEQPFQFEETISALQAWRIR